MPRIAKVPLLARNLWLAGREKLPQEMQDQLIKAEADSKLTLSTNFAEQSDLEVSTVLSGMIAQAERLVEIEGNKKHKIVGAKRI